MKVEKFKILLKLIQPFSNDDLQEKMNVAKTVGTIQKSFPAKSTEMRLLPRVTQQMSSDISDSSDCSVV
jgi:hypothetical protein